MPRRSQVGPDLLARGMRRLVSSPVSAVLIGAMALALLPVRATTAGAETVKCERAIAKAAAVFVQVRVAVLTKCEANVVAGKLTGNCLTEPKTQAAIAKASVKLHATIDKACGGDDKLCGGTPANEDTPPALGFAGVCPNFENGPCNQSLTDCGDIADCLQCIAERAGDQAIALSFGDLFPTDPKSQKTQNKCQQAIGKAASAFFVAKSKALQTCWDARFQGKHAQACPSLGDGKAAAAISKAEAKLTTTICKACAGGDADKNGLCDPPRFDPQSDIGFAATCQAVQVPGGRDCGAIGAVDTLDRLVSCVDCVTEFKVDCIDAAQVPALVGPYPADCE